MQSVFTRSVTQTKPSFDFVAAHFQCEENRFSKENPDGYVNFGSAQNFLHPDLIGDRLAFVEGHPDDTHYQSFAGTADCRTSIADYLHHQSGILVSPQSVVVGNGIISVLEALTIALLDEGDSMLIPVPVFPGLVNATSLRVQSKVEMLELSPENGFRLTPSILESHLYQLAIKGKRVRAILVSSPGNPIGQVFSPSELREFLDIAKMFDCSLIVDEVYAGSVYDGTEFTSATTLRSKHVYVLGGLSKDFGLAGHATGWLQSTNRGVIAAVAKQSHFFRLPAPVQRTISAILQPSWRQEYLRIHRKKLTQIEQSAHQTLEANGIAVAKSDAGLCLWLDLRNHLSSQDLVGEMDLYKLLLDQHRVHISPGTGFKTTAYGFFRMCFSQPERTLQEGLKRLVAGLQSQ